MPEPRRKRVGAMRQDGSAFATETVNIDDGAVHNPGACGQHARHADKKIPRLKSGKRRRAVPGDVVQRG
ncbi:hypothetical protein CBM2609_B10108 [Cupriavidus taiwanensis]|uniref:Uncharacterized protein n=1 Tax=Cupriavidus taiwanensis TaxID=164546 RepID=A0A375E550_9BURK|nr:hypothetical protein CBM2604_B10107 [Cupriavidus taiwanensis]SOZ29829.1 hypothetical protein CBM2609_B10108 [Cupriavidus taiwanensis]SOZ46953.1 hypothetical protein CBM2610_B10106 [Cupriavidus taiwanensis]SOZ62320.1 hypothetical protein CBM2615_B10333 [Cupriavidus taiwanensis]SOZ62442.1 hypothetical protein CBM2614_B10241 [Cupriavidus taiwanensis]